MARKFPFVYVKWVDSSSPDTPWMPSDEVVDGLPLAEIWTVGWLVADLADRIIVAASRHSDNSVVGDITCIPRVSVVSVLRPDLDTMRMVTPDEWAAIENMGVPTQ